jgi:hypothetical protein
MIEPSMLKLIDTLLKKNYNKVSSTHHLQRQEFFFFFFLHELADILTKGMSIVLFIQSYASWACETSMPQLEGGV